MFPGVATSDKGRLSTVVDGCMGKNRSP